MEFKKKKYHILWLVYSSKYYYLPYFLQIFQYYDYYRVTKTISSNSTHFTLRKKEYRSISIKLCHIYVTRSKKKKKNLRIKLRIQPVTKTYRSISTQFRFLSTRKSYPSYLRKNCPRA